MPPQYSSPTASHLLLEQIVEGTVRLATSWSGMASGLFLAFGTVISSYIILQREFPEGHAWLLPLFIFPLLIIALASTIRDRVISRRQITPRPTPHIFQLKPRENERTYNRQDQKHEEV